MRVHKGHCRRDAIRDAQGLLQSQDDSLDVDKVILGNESE